MSKMKGNVSSFHGMGQRKGRDGLFLGVKVAFSTMGWVVPTVMSLAPLFFLTMLPSFNTAKTYFFDIPTPKIGGDHGCSTGGAIP